MEESDDRLLGGRVTLHQPRDGYRAAIDPVILAAAVPVESGEQVLDVGCGTGAAALCLATRVPDCGVAGVEIQSGMVRYARQNVACNGLDARISIIHGDIVNLPLKLNEQRYDHVMTNPPFMVAGTGNPPSDAMRTIATVESVEGIDPWIGVPLRILKNKGTMTLIHRADRLDDVLAAMNGRFGDIRIFPLWPGPGLSRPAKRVVVQARKGSNAPLTLLPGMVLHGHDGEYTDEADAVLRDGAMIHL